MELANSEKFQLAGELERNKIEMLDLKQAMAKAIFNAGATIQKIDHPKPTSNQNGEDEVNPPMLGNVSKKNPSMPDDLSKKTPKGSTRGVSIVGWTPLEPVKEESLAVSENRVSGLREKIASNRNISKPAPEPVKPPPVSSAFRRVSQVGG